MSNAMKNRLSAAKTGAGESVKAKSTRAPLIDVTPPLQVIANTDNNETVDTVEAVTELSLKERMASARTHTPDSPVENSGSHSTTTLAIAVDVLDDEPESRPGQTFGADANPIAEIVVDDKKPSRSTASKTKAPLLDELCAPPAPMGTVGESRLMTVPLTEDAYALMQRLDRAAALQLGRPINRTRLITKALETVLADPEKYAGEYLAAQQGGTTWKRRTQGRIPTTLADILPSLRYTGSHRQSAGMMVSIALSAYLEKATHELAT